MELGAKLLQLGLEVLLLGLLGLLQTNQAVAEVSDFVATLLERLLEDLYALLLISREGVELGRIPIVRFLR